MYEKMLVDTYPGFLSLRNEHHQIVWLNQNFQDWIALYTDVDPIGKTNTELALLVPQNVADTFLQCHDGSLDLASDHAREGLKKVIEFVSEDHKKESSQYFDVLKYKVSSEGKPYIFTIAYDISDLYKENQQNLSTSMTDMLTQCDNRRYFEKNYGSFVGHVVAMFDLDNFKLINDQEGHITGDHILKEFCTFMKTNVQDVINIIRMGGDEFIIVFKIGAETKQIENTLKGLRIQYEQTYQEYGYLSYSFGLGIIGDDLSKSLANIDEQMYADKARK